MEKTKAVMGRGRTVNALKPSANCSGTSLPLVADYRRYEGTVAVCQLVHPVGALLAVGGVGADSLSVGLAGVAAPASGGNHAGSGIRSAPGFIVSPRAAVGMAAASLPRSLKSSAHATGPDHDPDRSGNPERHWNRCGDRHGLLVATEPLHSVGDPRSLSDFFRGKFLWN
jgi:hypothetical protein